MPELFSEFADSSHSLIFAAVGAGLAIIIVCLVVLHRARMGLLGFVLSILVFLSTIFGTSLAWTFHHYAAPHHETRERILESRLDELKSRALSPGSAFACLDPSIGESIQFACEHEVFASPATVATEISYVWSEFTLLSDIAPNVSKNDDIQKASSSLRQSLEADRFGFLAYLLAIRNGCMSTKCPALAVLKDPSHVRVNIVAHTFDHYLANYREYWSKTQEAAVARLTATPELSGYQPAPEKRKFVDIDFPTAASIPPVHIMTPDVGGTGAATKVGASGSTRSTESHTPIVRSPTHTQATLASPSGIATDPVWMPNSNSTSSPSTPMHLSPSAPATAPVGK